MAIKKEPIKSKRLVFGFLAVVALSIPWYFAQGTYEPLILGFPYWAFASLVFTVVLAMFSSWIIDTQWDEAASEEIVSEYENDYLNQKDKNQWN